MAQQKLYTEEQVKEVVRLSLEDAEKSVIWSKEWYPQKLADKILQSLEPIELPSDEEIIKVSSQETNNINEQILFNNGAIYVCKLIEEQIVNQNK